MRFGPFVILLALLVAGMAWGDRARGHQARPERPRLVLIRHGESEANRAGIYAGLSDAWLTELGRAQAFAAGQSLRGIRFDRVYSSRLSRAAVTARLMLEGAGQPGRPVIPVRALIERRSGVLRGLTHETVERRFGPETERRWRKTWDGKIPDGKLEKGESLRQISARLGPFFDRRVMRDLRAGRNVALASHMDTLHALIGRIEGLDDAQMAELNVRNATPVVYRLELDGRLVRER